MKIRNIRELKQYLAKSPDFQIFEKPSTTNKHKLLHFIKGEDTVLVVKGSNQ